MICPNCGKEFTERTVIQKFCCKECGYQYRLTHKPEYPSITFNCSYCGRTVVTDGVRDKRTRFCCQTCEKKYWRHPPHEQPTSHTNFHNVAEYLSYERRSNR